jgi:localization factor PodJL
MICRSHFGLESYSMKPGIPWSVKGVEPELREIAKTAARRSGMTLGEWLNSAINEQADENSTPTTDVPVRTTRSRISTHPIERAATRLEDIAEQLSKLARRESETTQHFAMPPAEESAALHKILNRVESNERQTVEAFTAINERLATMSRQVTQSIKVPKPEEAPGFQALEKAVRNIVEHLEISEKRTRDNLKSLQERMGDMSTRASGSGNNAPAFSQLENRLSELARRVDQGQGQPAQGLPDLLRHELDDLAGRIETVRDTAEVLASKAQTQAVQASQAELRTIEDRILGLLREAQTSFVASSNSPAEIQKFRGEIEKLNNRIDEAAQGAASNRDVSALRVAVEQLSTRVAQGPDTRPLADMDRRILDISQRLEQSQAAARDMPQFNDLERRMVELDHRLNDAIRLQGDGKASVELEAKLAEVNDRLGRTEHQLSHLETIEKAISQLYDSMEQSRNWTREVAEDAAKRMGEHIMNQPQAVASFAGSPEFQALEQGLNAVREASHVADSRNQETLEAVHETLEQIVTKLAELETAAIGQRIAQVAAPTVAAVQQAVHETAVNAPAAGAEPYAFEAPQEFEPEAPAAHNVFAEDPAAALNPFDPSPAEDQSAGRFDTVIQASRPDESSTAGTEDYIAAARRMHQASNQHKSILTGLAPGAAKFSEDSSKKLKSFKLPFRKGTKTAKPAQLAGDAKLAPEIKPAANSNNATGLRKNLMVMGMLLLSAAAFFTVKNFVGNPADMMPSAEPAAIVQPVDPAPAPAEVKPAAPVENNVAPAAPAQHSDSGMVSGGDDILTGSLSAAMAVTPMAPGDVTLEEVIGTAKLREAASVGDPNAQFVIATRYLNGENVPIDYAKAAYWYGKAAAAGLAPAQYRVATLFERGKGVNKDMNAALSWYERAGELGNVKAMHNAAVIAAGNEAGGPDYKRAYKWFSMAAAHGLKDSEFNFAVLIERGLGTKPDPVEALFWYSAAAAQQDPDAQAHVEALTKTLSPATVEEIKTRLQNWVPDRGPDAANVVAIDDSAWSGGEQKQEQSAVEPKDPVMTTQSLLGKLGYNVGAPDGKMGGRTANAIRLFQLQEGMKVTGEISPELISAMESKAS